MSRNLRTTWPTFRTRIAIRSDDTALGQARVTTASDDHVVVHAQVEQPCAFDQLARQADVLPARRGVTARVVVQQDDRRGRFQDGRLEDLAPVHETGRERSL